MVRKLLRHTKQNFDLPSLFYRLPIFVLTASFFLLAVQYCPSALRSLISLSNFLILPREGEVVAVVGTSSKSWVSLTLLALHAMSYAPVTDIPRRGEVQFDKPAPRSSKLNLKTWGRKSWAGALIVAAIVIAAIVLGAVLGSRANRYPSYSKLHYSVVDTCEYPFLPS